MAWIAAVLAALVAAASPNLVAANAPDPILGGTLFATDQPLSYSWDAAKVPEPWMQTGINAGAGDANKLAAAANAQGTKIATFAYASGGTSKIAMSQINTCASSDAIARFNRNSAPNSFTMTLNKHGMVLASFTLKWCAWYAAQVPAQPEPATGCYDVANLSMDEFGHVLILNHHATAANESDYSDAVVQTLAHAKAGVGWNADVFGRCDVASLQSQYGMTTSSKLYSTCLTPLVLPSLAFSASPTSTPLNGNVTFTATLTTGDWPSDFNGRISLKPAHARTVVLQRAPVGSSSFTDYLTMLAGTTAGTYTATFAIFGTYQWRANFPQPTNEGFLAGVASSAVTVTCTGC
jgi:hypothetical protein